MKRILITGFSGFVSRHFLDYLEKEQIKMKVMGIDRHPFLSNKKYKHLDISSCAVDLMDQPQLRKIVDSFKPDYVLHLAAFSSVAYSWDHPVESFQNNTNIFLNLVESIRKAGSQTRILSVGSSEEYGNIEEDQIPIKETAELNPLSPYAVARVAQEMLAKVFVDNYGLDIVMTRSFNHIGPGQKDVFVISSFAKQLMEIKRGGSAAGQLKTGDISIVRDFLDVRDVVAAYYKLLILGKKGEIYNVCSGQGITLKEVVEKMVKLLKLEVNIRTNEGLIRPNDNKIIIGSNSKIKKEVGWRKKIGLTESLKDIFKYWDQELENQINP